MTRYYVEISITYPFSLEKAVFTIVAVDEVVVNKLVRLYMRGIGFPVNSYTVRVMEDFE